MAKLEKTSPPVAYKMLRDCSSQMKEKNDCAVIAVAIACDVPYNIAHAALKKLGRKEGQGTHATLTENAITLLGKKLIRVDPKTFIATYPGVHKNIKTVTTHHPRRFPDSFNKTKTYLFRLTGHILAVKHGETMDWTVNTSKRVSYIYEVI